MRAILAPGHCLTKLKALYAPNISFTICYFKDIRIVSKTSLHLQSAIGFGQQSSPSFQVAQQQAPASVGVLATVDNKQLTHYTKWEEINPQGLQQLLGLE